MYIKSVLMSYVLQIEAGEGASTAISQLEQEKVSVWSIICCRYMYLRMSKVIKYYTYIHFILSFEEKQGN